MTETGLSGRLSEFNLEEILQLIALQQKTGLLRVDSTVPMALYFEQGILVSYRDRRESGKDPLETFLKSYGFFSHSAWDHVEFVQRNADLDLTEILLNEGMLDTDGLAAAEQEAAQEFLHHGMMLRDGRYQFLSGRSHLSGLKGRVRMKADGLLMEAVRRIDEMPSLLERYHGGEAKISRSEEEADLSKSSTGVQRVWSLLDRDCPVKYLIANGRMSEFDLYTTLEALREMGLIEIEAGTAVGETANGKRKRIGGKQESRHIVPALMLSILSLLLIAGAWYWMPARHFSAQGDALSQHAAQWRTEAERAQLEATFDLYYGAHNRYPKGFEELRSVGYLPEGERPEERWEYESQSRHRDYRLESILGDAAR